MIADNALLDRLEPLVRSYLARRAPLADEFNPVITFGRKKLRHELSLEEAIELYGPSTKMDKNGSIWIDDRDSLVIHAVVGRRDPIYKSVEAMSHKVSSAYSPRELKNALLLTIPTHMHKPWSERSEVYDPSLYRLENILPGDASSRPPVQFESCYIPNRPVCFDGFTFTSHANANRHLWIWVPRLETLDPQIANIVTIYSRTQISRCIAGKLYRLRFTYQLGQYRAGGGDHDA